MSIHADPLFITSEVDRRLELAGVRRDGRHHVDLPPALGTHPLAALVARLVGGHAGPATPVRHEVATRRPRHP